MEVTYGKYIPLERAKIDRIVKEWKFEQTDLFDEEKCKEVGKLVGADAVVLGKVTLWKKGTFFTQPAVGYSARCVSVETGEILWASSLSGTVWKNAMEERKPEIVAQEVALEGLSKIRYMLLRAKP